MKIIFAGTPEFAVASLRALAASGHEVSLVVTQPDRPAGRGRGPASPPVKRVAAELGVAALQVADINARECVGKLAELRPDCVVVVAFSQMLRRELLNLPTCGCVNLHASLLPRLRGAAPISWALIRGEKSAGVTTQRMARRMDAGDILLQRAVAINASETAGLLHDRLAPIGAELLVRTLDALESGDITPTPQDDSLATFAPCLTKRDGAVDWTEPAESIRNRIRGLTPWPSAYTFKRRESAESVRIVLLEAAVQDSRPATPGEVIEADGDRITVAAGRGALRLLRLQRAGGKPLDAAAFLRGFSLREGDRLEREA